jgi:hypothetical protein
VKTKARQEIIKKGGGGGGYVFCPNVNRITSYFNSLREIILMITVAQLIALNRITDKNLYKRFFYLFKVMFRLNLIQDVRSDQLTDKFHLIFKEAVYLTKGFHVKMILSCLL